MIKIKKTLELIKEMMSKLKIVNNLFIKRMKLL